MSTKRGSAADPEATLAVDADPDDGEEQHEEVELQTGEVSPGQRIPLFKGVRVVYMGSRRHQSPTIKGRVIVEHLAGGDARRADARGGNVNYDFRAYDALGHKAAHSVPDDYPEPSLRGRPFQFVEHAEHIYFFARHKAPCECEARPGGGDRRCGGGYRIRIADPETREAVKAYVTHRESRRKRAAAFVAEATANR